MESLNPFYHSHSNNKAKGSFEGLCVGLLFLFQVGFPFEEVKFISIEVSMATKIKGLYKGIKCISHIFVVKEKEMEIGYPTDVKHVAHIGWDGPSGCGPTWMNEFKAAPEFSSSLGSIGELRDSKPTSRSTSWASPELGQPLGRQSSDELGDLPPSDLPKAPKKHKRRKTKSTSSPKSSPTPRTPRAGKSKLKHSETENPLSLQQV